MNDIDDGGPAFPVSTALKAGDRIMVESSRGLSLRDYFAAKAMQALISSNTILGDDEAHRVALLSYHFSDAMLAIGLKSNGSAEKERLSDVEPRVDHAAKGDPTTGMRPAWRLTRWADMNLSEVVSSMLSRRVNISAGVTFPFRMEKVDYEALAIEIKDSLQKAYDQGRAEEKG